MSTIIAEVSNKNTNNNPKEREQNKMNSPIGKVNNKNTNNNSNERNQIHMNAIDLIDNDEGNPFVDKALEQDRMHTRMLTRPDATSAEEVQNHINELPVIRNSLDRECGEALWGLPDKAAKKIDDIFRQMSEEPPMLPIFEVLIRMEKMSREMSELSENSKPLVMELAKDYFAHPEKYPAVPELESERLLLVALFPTISCLPKALQTRLQAKLNNRLNQGLHNEELALFKLLDEYVQTRFHFVLLSSTNLHTAVNNYNRHRSAD